MTPTPHNFLEETKKLSETIQMGFMLLAQNLYKIYDKNLWVDEYDTYEDFLEYCDLKPSAASKLRSIYEAWVIGAGLKLEDLGGVSQTSLYAYIPRLSSGNPADLLAELKLLRTADALENVREFKNPDCVHDFYTIRVCKLCQKKEKIYEEN